MHQAEQSQNEVFDQEQRVAEYLMAHPDFLVRHPEVLTAIEVPHGVTGAVSLIEYQVRALRRQLATERNRFIHLIARAREYESLSTRLHGLILQLMVVDDSEPLCHLLRETLLREFHAEALAFKLFALAAIEEGAPHDPLANAFADFIDRRNALCGPLSPERAVALFGEGGAGIHSAAIVPIHASGQSGIIAIGSADATRFSPDMGTDFLNRLGEIISQKLRAIRFSGCEPH
ncbi:DUF484 family protein [Allochromatium palmeri]|uniref:DUF484 family protein n=1 Tax=Allochromatium palmeri TaxID=231048 RepID=A0A6N8EBI7_9GAMM|nr:DUF484 family protein [Allochromatium palmeri]MTW20850.1 DUF484 family protein [Allochromatium palmeri]